MSTDKPDLSEFLELGKPARRPCHIAAVLNGEDGLTDVEKKQLEAALAQPKSVITGEVIVQWLAKRDIDINRQRVGNHRRGACTCE